MFTRMLTTSVAVVVLALALVPSAPAAPLFIENGVSTAASPMTVTFNDSKTLTLVVATSDVGTVGDYIDGVTDCDEITSTTFECDMTGSVGMTALPWSSMGDLPDTIFYDDGERLGSNEEWHRFQDENDGQKIVVALQSGDDDDFETAISATPIMIYGCLQMIDLGGTVRDCGSLGDSCMCIEIGSAMSKELRVEAAADFLFAP